MKNIIKKFIISLNILFGVFVITNNVFAMTPTFPNDAKFSRGVGNAYYYVDASASGYTQNINDSVNNWVDTGWGWNPIYLYPVASNYATHIDYYLVDYTSDSLLANTNNRAYTTFWDIDENGVLLNSGGEPMYNYFYTEIKFSSYHQMTVDTIIHEMGHAFGLAHYDSNAYSIMYPYRDYRMVTTVQKEDHDTINYLYN